MAKIQVSDLTNENYRMIWLAGNSFVAVFFTAAFAAFILLLASSLQAQVMQLDPVLSEHIREAQKNNPDLTAWHDRVEAASQRIPQADAWPDPTLGFSAANLPTNTFAFDQEPMTAVWIQAGQRIPLGGKPSAMTHIAENNYEAAQNGEEAQKFDIAREIAGTWYDWAYWREAVATVDANIQLLDDLIAVARRKYETGRGLQQDILRAETERSRLEDRRVGLRQMALTTGRRLAVLMGRKPDDVPEVPSGLTMDFAAMDRNQLLSQLLDRNPSLKRMRAELASSESRITLARRNWWPDLNLGVGYGFRQDSPQDMERPDFFTVSAGISIPLYGGRKQGRAVEEAKAMSGETEAKLQSLELDLRFSLDRFLDEDGRLQEQVKLYQEGVEPQAEATLSAATAEYTVGKVDFEALMMAETALYNARLDRYARVRDRLKVRASLAALVGDQELLPTAE